MFINQFSKCRPGTMVTDGQRIGRIIRISNDKSKALVMFTDGYKEWIEYYKIEVA